jgi:hypothetical protein
MIDNPFSKVPDDPESVVAIVKREAVEECANDACPIFWALDDCTRDAVSSYWGSRVKTFVPLLALRRVRSCIKAGTCETSEW